MSDDPAKRIERLKGRVGQLQGDLEIAKAQLREAMVDAAPFQAGGTATYQGVEVIIRRVEPQSWGACWYRVSKRKKNGDWSLSELQAFDRELTAADPQEAK